MQNADPHSNTITLVVAVVGFVGTLGGVLAGQ
jgi:hypothetical protein